MAEHTHDWKPFPMEMGRYECTVCSRTGHRQHSLGHGPSGPVVQDRKNKLRETVANRERQEMAVIFQKRKEEEAEESLRRSGDTEVDVAQGLLPKETY